MSKLQEQFDLLLQEQADLTKRFQEKAQELFKETTKEFFDKNPAITAVIWTQYTPYFNDGDTCEFAVHEPYFTNAKNLDDITRWGEYEGEDEENEWSMELWSLTSDSDWAKEARSKIDMTQINLPSISKFSQLIQSSDMEEVMEAMFGDHVRVVATREGFDVDDHDHD
jgi:hypothetical protein